MPWVNADENVINAMLIPWPMEVTSDSFEPASDLAAARRSVTTAISRSNPGRR